MLLTPKAPVRYTTGIPWTHDQRAQRSGAIVTGANHGIGAATTVALAAHGASVLATYLRLDDPDQAGTPATYAENRARAADEVTTNIRAARGAVLAIEADLVIAEFARRHIARGATWGRIVGLTSGGPQGFPGEVSYGAAKAALNGLSPEKVPLAGRQTALNPENVRQDGGGSGRSGRGRSGPDASSRLRRRSYG